MIGHCGTLGWKRCKLSMVKIFVNAKADKRSILGGVPKHHLLDINLKKYIEIASFPSFLKIIYHLSFFTIWDEFSPSRFPPTPRHSSAPTARSHHFRFAPAVQAGSAPAPAPHVAAGATLHPCRVRRRARRDKTSGSQSEAWRAGNELGNPSPKCPKSSRKNYNPKVGWMQPATVSC